VCSNFFQIVEKAYSFPRARSSRVSRACATNSAIVEAIRNSLTTAVLELDRARDLPWNVTSLVRPASAALSKRSFMATKSTITPREFLAPHVQGGVVAARRRITERPVMRPIRTVCAWCAGDDRPVAVLVDVPIDDRGLSHGICPACRTKLRSDSWAALGSSGASATWR
jgi:hypothetical protein